MYVLLCIICIILTPSYHKYVIYGFLRKYNCDVKLYEAVLKAKHNITKTECIRVEASIKNGKPGRYTIPILFSEFIRYTEVDQNNILHSVHITKEQYLAFVDDPQIIRNTDIIFGLDGDKGKMYLDYGTRRMRSKCLESDGKTKEYYQVDSTETYNLIHVYVNGQMHGKHYYLKKPITVHNIDEKVYWIGHSDSGTTYYFRPYLPLLTLMDVCNLYII